MNKKEFIYIWAFEVKVGREADFERAYGSDGDWVQLFRQGRGYLQTQLIRDTKNSRRYVTIDHWENESVQRAFREQFAAEFLRIDQACEQLTESETLIGQFTLLMPVESKP